MVHLLWGCVLLISCTFILFLLKKKVEIEKYFGIFAMYGFWVV